MPASIDARAALCHGCHSQRHLSGIGHMKVIICGAGQVGWQIARHLSGENNDVTVVDNNPDLVRRATDTLDVQGLTGFASHPDVLDTRRARATPTW
jgi:nucleoside-diphosphate-sugar epimerase